MVRRRLQVLASIATRLSVGTYPLAFLLLFGWAYGKESFDIAATCLNWAGYLNIFLLSGFSLAPPAMARLLGGEQREASACLRDHLALERLLLLVGSCVGVVLWFSIRKVFPNISANGDNRLLLWFPIFAVLTLSQLPLVLWMGIAQAAERYRETLIWTLAPRAAGLLALVAAAFMHLDPTAAIAVTTLIVISGQLRIAFVGRAAAERAAPQTFAEPGRAANVLWTNLSAGTISLVGTVVTIAPVTLVGRMVPNEVGLAHVIVTLSNAFGAVVVAAFFPASVALAASAALPKELRRHSFAVAGKVGLLTIGVLAVAWAAFPVCLWIVANCDRLLYAASSLVLVGAGLRLASVGVFHGAVCRGHPHLSLVSAVTEAVTVGALAWILVESQGLLGVGFAFCAGGAARLLLAFQFELPLIARDSRVQSEPS